MRTISLLFVSAWLLVAGACVAETADDSELAPLATEAESLGAAESALTSIPLCGDLPNQTFVTLQSCTRNGQLGTQECTQTCTLHRSIRFTPTGVTCVITGSTCGPQSCGACQVIGPQGPLG
jgi:hypothetical protein